MFRGISPITIDGKGRFALPVRCRALLGESSTEFVVTIDPEETCLLLYPVTHWQIIEDKLQNLPSFNGQVRRIQRLLIGHATDVELDSNGRLLLPLLLREYASLNKHVVMVGQGNKFELWDEGLWQAQRQQWLAEEAAKINSLPEEMKNFSL